MSGKEGVQTLNDEKQEQRIEDPFDIFSVPAINTDYEKFEDHYIEPSNNITQTGPIVFEFGTGGGEKWDSNFTELETEYEIHKAGTKTLEADDISVINSLPITHYEKIEVKMNDKIVTNSSSGNHAYHAYFQQKFTYSKSVKKDILKRTELYYEEDADKVNQISKAGGDDTPFTQKHKLFVEQVKPVISRTQLYLDIANVHKYYPTDIDYVVTFTRNTESFCLMGISALDGIYKIVIKKIRLIIRKIIPSNSMIEKERAFMEAKRTAYIPYTHGIMTSQLMQEGTMTKTFRDVCAVGTLPKQLFVFLIDHQAYAGKESFINSRWRGDHNI